MKGGRIEYDEDAVALHAHLHRHPAESHPHRYTQCGLTAATKIFHTKRQPQKGLFEKG